MRTIDLNFIVDNADVALVFGLDIVIAGCEWEHDENKNVDFE